MPNANAHLAGFEPFDPSAPPSPSVTIQRDGLMAMNTTAYEALARPAAVTLLYNADRRLIALTSTDPRTPFAFPVRPQSDRTRYGVDGRAFLQHHGIDNRVNRCYQASVVGTALVIDVNQDVPEVPEAPKLVCQACGSDRHVTQDDDRSKGYVGARGPTTLCPPCRIERDRRVQAILNNKINGAHKGPAY